MQQLSIVGAAGVLCASLAVGCAGTNPGDYKVYRVGATSEELSSGCFAGSAADEVNDTSSIRTNGTFLLYAGAEGAYFLDMGSMTLDGIQNYNFEGAGRDYEFNGTAVDVGFSCSDGSGDKYTTTTKLKVSLAADGPSLAGVATTTSLYVCEGVGCSVPLPECTKTAKFVGTEIDATLWQKVGEGDSSPVPEPSAGQAPSDAPPVGTGGNCEAPPPPPPACDHSEHVAGGALDPTCNNCASYICGQLGATTCCTDAWDVSCVGYAAQSCP